MGRGYYLSSWQFLDTSIWIADNGGEPEKKLGMILFPLGVVTAVFGTLIPLPVSIVLILTGLIVLGVSLILLLPRQRRTLAQILKSFGRGDKHDQGELEEIGQ